MTGEHPETLRTTLPKTIELKQRLFRIAANERGQRDQFFNEVKRTVGCRPSLYMEGICKRASFLEKAGGIYKRARFLETLGIIRALRRLLREEWLLQPVMK